MREETPSQTPLNAAPSQTLTVGVRRWAGNTRSEEPNHHIIMRVDRLVPKKRGCDEREQPSTKSHEYCNSGHSRGSLVTSGSPVAVSGALDGLRAESVSSCAAPEAATAVQVLTFHFSLSQVGGLRPQRSRAFQACLPTLSSPFVARPLSDGDEGRRKSG